MLSPRSIWWSSNPTSSEIPRVDGEPPGAQSWVCLSKKIRSFPAEVGWPWTSLSFCSWSHRCLRLGSCSDQQRDSPYTWQAYFQEGVRSTASRPFRCPVWTGFLSLRFLLLSIYRYKSLCPETWPTWDGRPHDGVAVLVKHLGYKQEEYKMGRLVLLFS